LEATRTWPPRPKPIRAGTRCPPAGDVKRSPLISASSGYRVDDRVEGHVLFQTSNVKDKAAGIERTPGAGAILKAAPYDGEIAHATIRDDEVTHIAVKAAAPVVVSKLTPRQRAKRKMKNQRRSGPKKGN
jgi:hypothetical protein